MIQVCLVCQKKLEVVVTTLIRNLATSTLAVFAVLLFADYAVAKTDTQVAAAQLEQILVDKSPWAGEWSFVRRRVKTGDIKLQFEKRGGKLTVRLWRRTTKKFGSPLKVQIQDGAIKFKIFKGRVAATLRLEDSSLSGKFVGAWKSTAQSTERDVDLTPER